MQLNPTHYTFMLTKMTTAMGWPRRRWEGSGDGDGDGDDDADDDDDDHHDDDDDDDDDDGGGKDGDQILFFTQDRWLWGW